MSFNPRAFFVRDKPDFVSKVVETFSYVSELLMINDLYSANYALEVFESMIENSLGRDDDDFKELLEEHKAHYEETYQRRLKEYNKLISAAQCPDIISKPSRLLSRRDLMEKFSLLVQLCNIRGIFFTPRNRAHF